MKYTLQHSVTTGRLTLPVVTIICLLSWLLIPITIGWIPADTDSGKYNLADNLHLAEVSPALKHFAGFAVYTLMAYMLTVFNKVFALVRLRATVQTALFLLFITCCPMLYPVGNGPVTACCFLGALFFLFKSYQQQDPLPLFYSFVMLGTGSILLPQLIWLTPVWLAGALQFQSLNPRSFSAAISGLLMPFWFLFGHACFYDNLPLFTSCLQEMIHFVPINYTTDMPHWALISTIFLGILTLISSIHGIAYSYEDKIQTRAYLNFLILLSFCLLAFILLQPIHCNTLLIPMAQTSSLLTAHFFIQTNNRMTNILFIGAGISLLAIYIFNLWTLS